MCLATCVLTEDRVVFESLQLRSSHNSSPFQWRFAVADIAHGQHEYRFPARVGQLAHQFAGAARAQHAAQGAT
jgi:hypothetical protein